MSKRGILNRYLGIKQEEGTVSALRQLEKDKCLLPKSTYYWVRKKLTEEEAPIIYSIDEETVLKVRSKEVAEALDVASATTVKAILDHLKAMEEKGIDVKSHLKENSWLYELITDMAINGALAAFEYLGYIRYLSKEEIEKLRKEGTLKVEA